VNSLTDQEVTTIKETARRKHPSILVVDDNDLNLALMRDLLASRGYHVVTALSADDAWQAIRSEHPDLVLLDVIMPGRSGYDLCRQLKETPATRLIPVVMVTGLTDRDDRIRGKEAGADEFLTKPFFPEELFARVKSLLRLKEYTDELEHAEAVLKTLALSVEARDPYTEGHCERLSRYARDLGTHLGLGPEQVLALERGGFLHDLGKITIPDAILKKHENLTPEEWEIMKQHPVTGENICRPLRSLRNVLPIIRHHHEHWNGSGYPDGLHGKDIPLLARILQVGDVYDALRTERPYKPALRHEQCEATMLDEARRGLWDKELVHEFFFMLQSQMRAA
jgi:putative two-component system response regulator